MTETTVFRAATVIDGTGADPLEDATVVVQGATIAYVGPDADAPVEPDARVVDASGLCVMPGVIDCHIHLGGTESANYVDWVIEDNLQQAVMSTAQARMTLDHGVTTVRDISRYGAHLMRAIEAGWLDGPRIVACGQGLSRTGGHGDAWSLPIGLVEDGHPWAVLADGPEECRKAVRKLIRQGVKAIKVWATGGGMWEWEPETDQHYGYEELRTIVTEAAFAGLPVLAHCESAPAALDAAKAGVATIEHGEELDDETLVLMREKGIILVPTLALFFQWFTAYPVPPREELADYPGDTPSEKEIARIEANYRRARAAGIEVAVGSDSFSTQLMPYGLTALLDAQIMVRFGSTEMEAIEAATRVGAKALRIEKDTGTLEAGKAADLLVLEKSPLDDIANLERDNMLVILRGGRVYKDALTGSADVGLTPLAATAA